MNTSRIPACLQHNARATAGCILLTLGGATSCGDGSPPRIGSQSDESTLQAALRTQNPALVYDDSKKGWLSFSDGESLSSTNAKACGGQTTGFFNVPYRIGPTPAQLGDCWDGDVMPNGPGTWATNAAGSVKAPSMARIGSTWFIVYGAPKTSGQRCIGTASGTSSTGPTWTQRSTALWCPTNTALSASDPELWYDRANQTWNLLWSEDVSACDSRIMIQPLDTSGTQLAFASNSTARELLNSNRPELAFSGFTDPNPNSTCTNHVRRRIESPSIVRMNDSNVWVFFSANDRNSINYATGYAVCGSGSPTQAGASCIVFSPPQSAYRPIWGWHDRTAPVSGVNSTPFFNYPNMPGFGGLSVAVANPTSTAAQPVYAAAQLFFIEHAEVMFRVDASASPPALFEADTVVWQGTPASFPSNLGPTTPTGQLVAGREVAGFTVSEGLTPVFNTVAADGTAFASGTAGGNNIAPTADIARVEAYDPKSSVFSEVVIRTTLGADHIAARNGVHAGAFISDTRAIDHGNAVAFLNTNSYPVLAYGDLTQDPNVEPLMPSEGIWPEFGIATKQNGQWQVLDQFTGAELAASSPAGALACPGAPGIAPPGVKTCGVNEMALLPSSQTATSGNIAVAQYLGRPQGVMVLHYDRGTNGHYTVRIAASLGLPTPSGVTLAPQAISADPTSTVGDERFVVDFDGSSVLLEFSFDSTANNGQGAIRLASPPIKPPGGPPAAGYSAGRYDKDGNLWVNGSVFGMYERRCPAGQACSRKISSSASIQQGGCAFDQNKGLNYFTSNAFGQDCPPDYEFVQGSTMGSPWVISVSPTTNLVALTDGGGFDWAWAPDGSIPCGIRLSNPGQLLPMRSSRDSGGNLVFEAGQIANTALERFAANQTPGCPGEWKTVWPGAFDANGRLWYFSGHIVNGSPPGTYPQWAGAVDMNQLFDAIPPITLARTTTSIKVEAEYHSSFATQKTDKTPCLSTPCTKLVDPVALVRPSTQPAGNGSGTELVMDDGGVGHRPGTIEYKVWVPKTGTYQVAFKAIGQSGARIALDVDGVAAPVTQANTSTWGVVNGPSLSFATTGLHKVHLSRPLNTAGWRLDSFTLTRTSP